MPDLNWWQALVALALFFTVTGWASAMHQQAKRAADALEELKMMIQTELDQRPKVPELYP